MKNIVDLLNINHTIPFEAYKALIDTKDEALKTYLFAKAREVAQQTYGNKVYTRGLIEISNHCKNNCFYCGIRSGNEKVERYRLTKESILACCEEGYHLGFRTFVLQGGEDEGYTDNQLEEIVKAIKQNYPDCALTLSLGEKSYSTYKRLFDAGADRYLLRHETANEAHYSKLHPKSMEILNRKKCLWELKEIGYQVGTGFMVGSPYQTTEHLIEDLMFIKELQPHMIGIGPYLTHQQTPFKNYSNGDFDKTLILIAILRLMFPKALIPATTSLGTIHPQGRELGILAGANVVMPNLSPLGVRKKYSLYDNKICTGEEAAECRVCLEKRIEAIDYKIVSERGDYPK